MIARYITAIIIVQTLIFTSHAQPRWHILPDTSIEWNPTSRLPHFDHIEMSGQKLSLWVQYGVDTSGKAILNRTMVFPSFRLLPQVTIASMMYNVTDQELPRIIINNRLFRSGVFNATVMNDMPEKVISIRQKGIMQIHSAIGRDSAIHLKRTLFPSTEQPVAIEKWVFINHGKQPAKIEMEYLRKEMRPAAERTTPVQHSFIISTINEGLKTVAPGDSVTFGLLYQATNANNAFQQPDIQQEQQKRMNRVHQFMNLLQLETPDPVLNTAFAFAKIRATESIYLTKGGYLHGPGGLRYYAAIWANDQAEYVNPFFAFLGDDIAIQSSMNAYRWFAKYMNPDYKPIPSSIIAEGAGTWHGAKDRGDMAMIAYGATRFALAYGNKDSAAVLWPLIEWCLEYCKRKLTADGVVASNSDELEGRFPAGSANLNTSALYFDGLRSAVYLGQQLGKPAAQLKTYEQQAAALQTNIEKYFGATVEGFQTYRYYKENDTLRAWITTPLTVDIFKRREGTIAALFSSRLWTEDGLASLAGNKTFWDRSTLYGLRGAFAAGATDKALQFLTYYSNRRLLGDHIPYPVEAYPEGNQRHLSAESGLYCRIFTEGLFGMRPVGFNSFNCTPRLPGAWQYMALRNVHAFAHVFDIEVRRTGKGKLTIIIKQGGQTKQYTVQEGATKRIVL